MLERLRSLLRLLFVWKFDILTPRPTLSEPYCIIALAFGQAHGWRVPHKESMGGLEVTPGPVNEALARTMHYSILEFFRESAPLLAQWELLETVHGAAIGQSRPIFSLGSRDQYRNTREVLQEAKAIMAALGCDSALIVAQPWHLPRCVWTAEKLGIQVAYTACTLGALNQLTPLWNWEVEVPKDQRQTTSLPRWLWYELRARGYFWLKGWI